MEHSKEAIGKMADAIYRRYFNKDSDAQVELRLKAIEEKYARLYSMSHALEARADALVSHLRTIENISHLAQRQSERIMKTLERFDIERYEAVVRQIQLANSLRKRHARQTWMFKNGKGTKSSRRRYAQDKFQASCLAEHRSVIDAKSRGSFRWN